MLPHELVSLSREKLNEIKILDDARRDFDVVEKANTEATVVFEGFRLLSATKLDRFKEEYFGRHDIDSQFTKDAAFYQQGVQEISFITSAPELSELNLPNGFTPLKKTRIARYIGGAYGMQRRRQKIPTGDWAVKTTIGAAWDKDNGAVGFGEHAWAWELAGKSFLEFLPYQGRESAAKYFSSHWDRLDEQRYRLKTKSTAEILTGMLFSIETAKDVLAKLREPVCRNTRVS